MDFKQLFDDRKAVSPVIGVILMVAITVILAAVIGAFVLGFTDQLQNPTPQASFDFDTTSEKQYVEITHVSGDVIDATNVNVSATTTINSTGVSGGEKTYTWNELTGDTEVSAGSAVEIGSESDGFGGETVRVIYLSPDSDSSSTIGKFEVPS